MSYLIRPLNLCLCLFAVWSSPAKAQETTPSLDDVPQSFRRSGLPHWAEFPVPPTDVPTPAQIRANVEKTQAAYGVVAEAVKRLTWDEGTPEAFGSMVRARMEKSFPQPYDKIISDADIEAFAAQMRRVGQAPQPYDRY
jgi:hypothetical protein